MEEHMMTSNYTEPVAQLLEYGDPREHKEWPDYLSLGLTDEHIPDLINMAIDEELNWADSESSEVWAPLHAWRTLGQLRAEEAIEPLLALFHEFEELDNDWAASELPTIYGMIGPKSIPALSRYLSDDSNELYPRTSAAECIEEIGKTHADAKLECAQALSTQLEGFHSNPPPLNGFLISGLIDLQEADHLPLIRQAFKQKRVDLTVAGDIEDVEIELGVRKRRSTPRQQSPMHRQILSMLDNLESNRETQKEAQKPKIGRNDPCPCGSGKKYKKCCLKNEL